MAISFVVLYTCTLGLSLVAVTKGLLNKRFTTAFAMHLKMGVMQHLKVKGWKVYILYIKNFTSNFHILL